MALDINQGATGTGGTIIIPGTTTNGGRISVIDPGGTTWPTYGCAVATRSTITTVTNALTLIKFADSAFTIPANSLFVGAQYRCCCQFQYVRTTPTTVQSFEVDGLIGGVVKGTTGAMQLTISNGNYSGQCELIFVCTATGASGAGYWCGRVLYNCGTTVGFAYSPLGTPGGLGITPFTPLDTTVANTIDANIEFGNAIAGNSLIVQVGSIERMF